MRKINLAILGTSTAIWILASATVAGAAPDPRVRSALDHQSAQVLVRNIDRGDPGKTMEVMRKKTSGPQIPWTNGKPGKMALLNKTMLIKSGAMSKISANSDNKDAAQRARPRDASRRWYSNGKPGKMALLNKTKLINSGAMHRPDSIKASKDPFGPWQTKGARRWLSNGKKGTMKQLNLTMLIKAGAMARPDTIGTQRRQLVSQRSNRRTSRRVRVIRTYRANTPPRVINQSRLFRRERVGRFCSGRNCER